jgi:hypothetical protein
MTHTRKRVTKRPKDVLGLALKNLWQGETLICTERTWNNIRERVEAFKESHKDRRIVVIPYGPIKKIRRTA